MLTRRASRGGRSNSTTEPAGRRIRAASRDNSTRAKLKEIHLDGGPYGQESGERIWKTVEEADKSLAIVNVLSQEYEDERIMMLVGGDEELTRANIEKVVTNVYKRLQH